MTDDPIREAFALLADPIDPTDGWTRLRRRVGRARRRQLATISSLAVVIGVGTAALVPRGTEDVPSVRTEPPATIAPLVDEKIIHVDAFDDVTWVVTNRRVLRTTDDGESWAAWTAQGAYLDAISYDGESILVYESRGARPQPRLVQVDADGPSVVHEPEWRDGPILEVALPWSYSVAAMPHGYGFRLGGCTRTCGGWFWRDDVASSDRWTQMSDAAQRFEHPVCLDDGTCWAEGPPGEGYGERSTSVILRSTDEGRTWSDSGVPIPALARAHVVYASGDDFIVQVTARSSTGTSAGATAALSWLVSRDGGRTFATRSWVEAELPIDGVYEPPMVLFEAHDADSWTVATSAGFARTDDGGLSWDQRLGTADAAASMSWTSEHDGWIATADRLYRTTDGGATLIEVALPR